MELWGMPSLRGRVGQRQMGLPRMLQGAAGEVRGGGRDRASAMFEGKWEMSAKERSRKISRE